MAKSQNRIRVAIGIAGAALAIYLFYDIFRTTDLRQTVLTLESVSFIGVVLIFLPSIFGAFLDAYGWQKLLPISTLLGRRASVLAFWKVLNVRTASETIVNTVPLGAVISHPLKAWLLRRDFGISLASAFASVSLRTFLLAESQSSILLIVTLAGWSWLSSLSQISLHNGSLVWLCLSISVFALVAYTLVIIASCSGSLIQKLHQKLAKIKIARFKSWILEQEKHFRELNNELAAFATERRAALFYVIALYLIVWSMEGVETYIILRYLGVSISFFDAYAIEAVCSFIRSVAIILPSGLGAQDAGYVAFLNGIGESQPVAVAFILIKRLRQLVWIVAGGLLLLAFRRKGAIKTALQA
jgi:uncharacterized protein (TIRG00374 family)